MSVPVGIPVADAYQPTVQDDGLRALQTEEGYPAGLVEALKESLETNPFRFWVCDNSGSMGMQDGAVVHGKPPGGWVQTGRDEELKQTIYSHATLSDALGARSDFHFLHPRAGMQRVTLPAKNEQRRLFPGGIGCENSGDLTQVKRCVAKLVEPGNTTPLTEQVEKLISLLTPVAAELRQKGQLATVVIATDGLPNRPDHFLAAMKRLQQLPVWVIVRLCTDNDDIVGYWSELDKQLEAPLEVLDDLQNEAREVCKHNGWLTYAPQLHAARLFGLREKLYDRLDEAPLAPTQVKLLCEKLLGCVPLPEPELDAAEFLKQLRVALQAAPTVFDPLKGSMRPWVNVEHLAVKLFAWKHLGACGRCF